MFNYCDEHPDQFVPQWGQAYKVDADALDQVQRLLGFAVGGQAIIYAVAGVMLTIIAIAVSLSVASFIASNEHFLCIMRAVGYRFRDIALLFLIEFFAMTLVAAFFSLLFGVAFQTYGVPFLVSSFGIVPKWLDWSSSSVFLSLCIAYFSTSFIGLMVLFRWWVNNRYVGNKLQSL